MSIPNFQLKLGTTGATMFQADSLPLAQADVNGRSGWSYNKVSGAEKFNWYFYSGTYETMKMKHVKNMYFLGSIDVWTGIQNEAPFFVIYTKPKGDGTDAGAWYHSKIAYALHSASQLIRAGEKCLFYCMSEPEQDFGNVRNVPFKNRIDTGVFDLEDQVLYMTLHSDSGAVAQSTYVESLGAEMDGFDRRVADNHINMKLIV
jgi:hypothetical protein